MIVLSDSAVTRAETWFFWSHDVKGHCGISVMEYEQRMILKFLTNEQVDAHEISSRLSAQFSADTYTLRTIQF
jgi:hypothetical protein